MCTSWNLLTLCYDSHIGGEHSNLPVLAREWRQSGQNAAIVSSGANISPTRKTVPPTMSHSPPHAPRSGKQVTQKTSLQPGSACKHPEPLGPVYNSCVSGGKHSKCHGLGMI